MKIGFVVDDTMDKPDGVQQYVVTLGAWLAARGHTVHYLAGASRRDDIGTVHSLSRNWRVRFNGNRLSIPFPANRRNIRRLLQQEQYDVLHIQMPYSPMLAHQVVRLAAPSTAIIGTFHILPQNRLVALATHVLGRWTVTSLKRFDKVFAVSPAARDFAARAFRLQQVDVLPNVVDVDRFAQAEPIASGKNDVPTIVFLGRLVPRKGCALLLRALARLHDDHPDLVWRAIICGKGPLADELQRQAVADGLADRITFTGFVSESDKTRYLAGADLAVFPSTGGESFGIVLIEAMASGRPVVLAGDNPGYRSVLQARPEQLVDPADTVAFARRLQRFLADQSARKSALAWQHRHVKQFDVDRVGRQLEQAYRESSESCQRRYPRAIL